MSRLLALFATTTKVGKVRPTYGRQNKFVRKPGSISFRSFRTKPFRKSSLASLYTQQQFFVDNSGHVVGEIIEEANIEKYKEEVTSYLENQSNEIQDHA